MDWRQLETTSIVRLLGEGIEREAVEAEQNWRGPLLPASNPHTESWPAEPKCDPVLSREQSNSSFAAVSTSVEQERERGERRDV
jgi:hypothetical protein